MKLTDFNCSLITTNKSSRLALMLITVFTLLNFAACAPRTTPNETSSTSTSSPVSSSPINDSNDESLPKIVAFGDSLTAGYNLPQSESYPALLQQKLDADGYKYKVVNAGVSGDTSAGGVRRIDCALEGNVRIVILELGENDLLRGQAVNELRKNLSQIIERVHAKGAKVLLCGMLAPTNTGSEYQRQIIEAFQGLAREHKVKLIPFFLDRVAGIESLNQADSVHPNAEGTKIVAETVYQALKPMLNDEQ